MMGMISDPVFYLLAVPAVLLTGISKASFGGGLAILAVPLLALTVPVPQAAGIMLPVLCVMDLFGLWVYRREWDRRVMPIILPAAMVGIAFGTLSFGMMNEAWIRILLGLIAISFTLYSLLGLRPDNPRVQGRVVPGLFWAGLSGFTSFVAHAGGPPLQIYLLPQRMDTTRFVATTVVFFAVVNYAKLAPYAWLGQLRVPNLMTSLMLIPVVPLGIWIGLWLHGRIDKALFYRIINVVLLLTGSKLVYDGINGLG